ncbi:MAG: type II toxin-antitoxin system RelE/ParE family toxin [Longimicrobiales bacterium]
MAERRTEFHPAADTEFSEAIRYYEEREPGLGSAFLSEVRRLLDIVRDYPEIGAVIWNTRRRILLDRFPYALIYRVLNNGTIRVLAVMHLRREPTYWHGRR